MLNQLLEIVNLKQGNKEIALFYSNNEWSLEVGNHSLSVMLGEVSGEFATFGTDLNEVLREMKELLHQERRSKQ